MELPPPSDELALAGERWCDVVHRRQRYRQQFESLSDPQRVWSIDDAITENLDLRELLSDYLAQLATAAECDTAFRVLRSLTICDPTVGSGAFLFAALDVLEPLYAEVLARAEELEANGMPAPEFLAESRTHPSSRYWLTKTICLHNLFGVDLMQEAPEIAKLRLFLKLAAQIDRVEDLEPLPDLDFNIKTGNLLVGIADSADASRRLGGGRLDLGGEIAAMETLAAEMGEAYEQFVSDQSRTPGSGSEPADSKRALTESFDEARRRCHELLHSIRGTGQLDDWIASHQPFHWFVEFPSVWRKGGFDVVIGNPPYIKTSLVTDYTWIGYETQKCPDLYAVCMERATNLLNKNGRFAMIVMHNLCFSSKFDSLRKLATSQFDTIWLSSYWGGRMGLFTGANPQNSILLGSRRLDSSSKDQSQLIATCMNRWKSQRRSTLFNTLAYTTVSSALLAPHITSQIWPFTDIAISSWVDDMIDSNEKIERVCVKHAQFALWYKSTALYQIGVNTEEPPAVNPATGLPVDNSDSSRWMYFQSEAERDLALIALAGRWGYLWWLTYSDSFHVTRSTLLAFPGDIETLVNRASGDMETIILLELSRTLQEEMPKHLAWMKKGRVLVGRYNMLNFRYLTDQADWLLAKAWGLDEAAFEAAGNLRDRMVIGNKE